MISGEFRKGHFEFNVSSDGYMITPEEADLSKLVQAYFDKIYEGRRRSCRELEEILYG